MRQKVLDLIELSTQKLIERHGAGLIDEEDCYEIGCYLKSVKFSVMAADEGTDEGVNTLMLALEFIKELTHDD